MYVATNRQKPTKNAFSERAEMQRKAEEAKAKPVKAATPTPVASPKPDLEAMKAAAAKAAALVHAAAPVEAEPLTLDTLIEETSNAGPGHDVEVEQPEPKRGRKPSGAVKERSNAILRYLGENPGGLSKPQLAEKLGEKEANVYTSLSKLQAAGKVRNVKTETGGYRWLLV
jgi:hypothetical protein